MFCYKNYFDRPTLKTQNTVIMSLDIFKVTFCKPPKLVVLISMCLNSIYICLTNVQV